MSVFVQLSLLAVRPLVGVAISSSGLAYGEGSADAVASWLGERFTNHGDRVKRALRHANERAWRTLEMSLGGHGLFGRLSRAFGRADQKAMAEEVRKFLDEISPPDGRGEDFRGKCLKELAAARAAGLLEDQQVDLATLARAAGRLAQFSRPEELLSADLDALGQLRLELPEQTYPALRQFLSLGGARDGSPLLAEAARYFFRRQIETDEELFRGLSFGMAQASSAAQSRGFATLETALDQWGQQLQAALGDLSGRVDEIHENVLDIAAALRQEQAMGAAAFELLKEIHYRQQRLGMQGEVAPRDSLSIRSDTEKLAVKTLLARFRQLPADQQDRLPSALNGLGKLLVGTGEFSEARQVFQQVAHNVDADAPAAAEAQYNAYRAALEQRKWDEALAALKEALRLDADRFAPFPRDKYEIIRILGAGGFGVAFLCHDRDMDENVVIKSLYADDLERGIDDIFGEVRVLRRLDHPNIIRVNHCAYAGTGKQHPYFVMDYFEGESLAGLLEKKGTLQLSELLAIAIPTGQALAAAHAQNILHRDVKPDNVLVNQANGSWHVKLIDFGLALRQQTVRNSMSSGNLGQSVLGSSVAGTLEYAPPEQMGRIAGNPGPYSDIYSFAKLCCRAMFGTTDPRRRHMESLPPPIADLLDRCMEQSPADRPQNMSAVLAVLQPMARPPGTPAEPVKRPPAIIGPPQAPPPPPRPPETPRQPELLQQGPGQWGAGALGQLRPPPRTPENPAQSSDALGDFGLRVAAALIDGMAVLVVMVVFELVAEANLHENYYYHQQQLGWFTIIFAWLYFAFQERSAMQATLGKKMMGLRVTDETGRRITFAKASGRFFGKWLSACTLTLGFLMAIWTSKRQCLHDMLAGTMVRRKVEGER